eukprot:TRINITY_DN2944_c0_g1_i1.p1 TRINITY_DN2944_c0_g1~~TRINITY_DN2944_c0_g1_i1.p1  ORF type:complete len:1806 (+),score=491.12 TRINITY_DN2944_c0_g1_i1:681-5420(+)
MPGTVGKKGELDYHRIVIHGDDGGAEMDKAFKTLTKALMLRDQYHQCKRARRSSNEHPTCALVSPRREKTGDSVAARGGRPSLLLGQQAGRGRAGKARGSRTGGAIASSEVNAELNEVYRDLNDECDQDSAAGSGLKRTRSPQQMRTISPQNSGANLGSAAEAPAIELPPCKYEMVDGIVRCEAADPSSRPISYAEYASHIRTLLGVFEDGPANSVCRNRLKVLEQKYEMHITLNGHLEERQTALSWDSGGGVFSTMKVDHNRLATCMNAHELVSFIQEKVAKCGSDVVLEEKEKDEQGKEKEGEGHKVTLSEYMERIGVRNTSALTVDSLGLMPGPQAMFHRFDIFSKTLSRGGAGSVDILTLFLKFRGYNRGKYFAEVVRPVMQRSDREGSVVALEMRVPIFGMSRDEWDYLSDWIMQNQLESKNHRWIIQIPRISEIRKMPFYKCDTLQDQLNHIFMPIWKATTDPQSNVNMAQVLLRVGSFNIISDETGRGEGLPQHHKTPAEWDWKGEDVPDIYFNYFVWANIVALNAERARRGLNTFQYRPHCGEQGVLDHFASAYLLADSIYHGITAKRCPVLCYLFYMSQVGLVMSPLSNNCLHLVSYQDNPFPTFARLGFNVMLATDDPLHFHHSQEALLEEYGTCQKMYKMGSPDLCEVARNSVASSAFPDRWKMRYLGGPVPDGNNPAVTHVPDIRLSFRRECMNAERRIVRRKLRGRPEYDYDAVQRIFGDSRDPQRRGEGDELGASEPVDELPHAVTACTTESQDRTHPLSVDRRFSNGAAAADGDSDSSDNEVQFHRVEIMQPANWQDTDNVAGAVGQIGKALALRRQYIWVPPEEMWRRVTSTGRLERETARDDKDFVTHMIEGVFHVFRKGSNVNFVEPPLSVSQFFRDFTEIGNICSDICCKALAQRRLELLGQKYNMHAAMNSLDEGDSGQRKEGDQQHRDFYQSYKVDTHVHMAAGMTATQLLNFIMEKARNHSDDIVLMKKNDGANGGATPLTFAKLFQGLKVDATQLTVDTLNVQADATLFERFDNFNDKYNPMGIPDLRTLFLKTDNYMGGRYFAEMGKQVFHELERGRYTFMEGRLSIYGRDTREWAKLAVWFDSHGMGHPHNKWMVQVPRIYQIFRKNGSVKSFGQVLENIFSPLWEVSVDPAKDPKLDHFLNHMSGFDSVDNEATLDLPFPEGSPPDQWTSEDNPPYAYWMYYMWANIRALNEFRHRKGMCTWSFRPHCGESGALAHLEACFLTADAINHGIRLAGNPTLEYIYYLAQIGIAVSPLSNNSLWLEYLKNPFPVFFRRGLNVSLSTDDPLQFHTTQEPLVEEYSIASKIWKLSPTDMCEIARNSVMQSGFDLSVKVRWLGSFFFLSSAAGNNVEKSHLPDPRVQYRFEAYHDELDYLEKRANCAGITPLSPGYDEPDLMTRPPFVRFMYRAEDEKRVIQLMETAGVQRGRTRRKLMGDTLPIGDESAAISLLTAERDRLAEEVTQLKAKVQTLASIPAKQPQEPAATAPGGENAGKTPLAREPQDGAPPTNPLAPGAQRQADTTSLHSQNGDGEQRRELLPKEKPRNGQSGCCAVA